MKHVLIMVASAFINSFFLMAQELETNQPLPYEPFKIVVQPIWKNFISDMNNEFDEQWILAGSITFIKKPLDTIRLDTIILDWHGIPLDHLESSLYKKSTQNTFIPIEEYLMCDGRWNKKQQRITFRFPYQLHLRHTTTFYLVLTVPNHLVQELKQGRFEIVAEYLPEQYQDTKMPLLCLDNNQPIQLATRNTHKAIKQK